MGGGETGSDLPPKCPSVWLVLAAPLSHIYIEAFSVLAISRYLLQMYQCPYKADIVLIR